MLRVRVALTVLLLTGVAACGSSGKAAYGTFAYTPVPSTAPVSKSPTRVVPSSTRAATSSASSVAQPPPYIARVVWVTLPSGRSLQIYPTANGRVADDEGAEAEAWREVLRKAPDAGTPGMRAQFDCHWQFARLAAPKKPSWNLEPWRPVVSAQRMYDTRCNPGGPEV